MDAREITAAGKDAGDRFGERLWVLKTSSPAKTFRWRSAAAGVWGVGRVSGVLRRRG
jgi:hypothetical protein